MMTTTAAGYELHLLPDYQREAARTCGATCGSPWCHNLRTHMVTVPPGARPMPWCQTGQPFYLCGEDARALALRLGLAYDDPDGLIADPFRPNTGACLDCGNGDGVDPQGRCVVCGAGHWSAARADDILPTAEVA